MNIAVKCENRLYHTIDAFPSAFAQAFCIHLSLNYVLAFLFNLSSLSWPSSLMMHTKS